MRSFCAVLGAPLPGLCALLFAPSGDVDKVIYQVKTCLQASSVRGQLEASRMVSGLLCTYYDVVCEVSKAVVTAIMRVCDM
jgi:hypothetical protein